MTRDWDLLQKLGGPEHRQALGELAARYLDFVYSAAVRQVRDMHLAEDVTQTVFMVLSAKGASLRQEVVLAGWLFNAVRYAAHDATRAEQRRRGHERKAAEMKPEASRQDSAEEFEPLLDDCLGRLKEKDRTAVLLRYLRGMSLREVGENLGISEQAARKRVDRAVDKLRVRLVRVGMTCTAPALIHWMSSIAVKPVPTALQQTVSSGSAAGGTATTAAIAKAATPMRLASGINVAFAVAIVLVLTGAALVIWEVHTRHQQVAIGAQAEDPVIAAENAAIAAADAALAPQRGVALDPNLGWRGTDWGHATELAWIEPRGPIIRFNVNDPDKRKVWICQLTTRIDPQQFPMLTMKYRARNFRAGGYLLYLNDGTGFYNAGMEPFQLNQVKADGKTHELKTDLRRLQPKGKVGDMAIAVYSGNAAVATFDLLSLRFEAAETATSPAQPLLDDHPMSVAVTSEKDRAPVAGADVVVDAERRNYARRAITDASGKATLTPLSNSSGLHTLRVTKEGMSRSERANVEFIEHATLPISLSPTANYSGRVIDEAGQPVKAALVRLWPDFGKSNPVQPELAVTDQDGRWQSAVPSTAAKLTLMALAPGHGPALLELDVTGDRKPLEIQLTKAHTFSLCVVDATGKPIPGVSVGCDGWWRGLDTVLSWSATTDVRGRVAWTYAPDDPMRFYVYNKQGQREIHDRVLSPNDLEQILTLGSDTDNARQ